MPTYHATANLAWSADGGTLVAGTDVVKGAGVGALLFFEPRKSGAATAGGATADDAVGGVSPPSVQIGVAPGDSVVAVHWAPRVQHLFCGTGGGATRVLYDPSISTKVRTCVLAMSR